MVARNHGPATQMRLHNISATRCANRSHKLGELVLMLASDLWGVWPDALIADLVLAELANAPLTLWFIELALRANTPANLSHFFLQKVQVWAIGRVTFQLLDAVLAHIEITLDTTLEVQWLLPGLHALLANELGGYRWCVVPLCVEFECMALRAFYDLESRGLHVI